MKANYPVAIRGGVAQQRYEADTRIQCTGVKRLLRVADVALEHIRTVVDLGCRNGDTTLGIAQVTNGAARVIGVEEYREALLIAKAKFGMASETEMREVQALLPDLPSGWLDDFRVESLKVSPRVSFVGSTIEGLPSALGGVSADLVVGFQILHWLNASESGLPNLDVMTAISKVMAKGARFISGTSTAFIAISPEDTVEGKTRAEYAIDEHPFVQMVYGHISSAVAKLLGYVPEPISAKPPLSLDLLTDLFLSAGFVNVKTGAFLVTGGRDNVIGEVMRLRPVHQGRLNGVEEPIMASILNSAISAANADCDLLVRNGGIDPRLDDAHIYDAVPYVLATKK